MTEEDIYHFQCWHLYCHLYDAFAGGDFDGSVSASALFALQLAARRGDEGRPVIANNAPHFMATVRLADA